jgi:hypothetical protein
MARKGFEETFQSIFSELLADKEILGAPVNPSLDLGNPASFAEELEEELFKVYSTYGVPNDTVTRVDLVQEQISQFAVQPEGSIKSSFKKTDLLYSGR